MNEADTYFLAQQWLQQTTPAAAAATAFPHTAEVAVAIASLQEFLVACRNAASVFLRAMAAVALLKA